MPAGPIDDVDEIPHEAIVEEAVIKIAGYPCGKQSQRDVSDFTVGSCEQKHRNHDHQRHDQYHCQNDKILCRYLSFAQMNPPVLQVIYSHPNIYCCLQLEKLARHRLGARKNRKRKKVSGFTSTCLPAALCLLQRCP